MIESPWPTRRRALFPIKTPSMIVLLVCVVLTSVGAGDGAEIETQERQRLNQILYRNRQLEVLLRRARSELTAGNMSVGLTALQRILDAKEDSFVWVDSEPRPSSLRREASRTLSSLPADAWNRYEKLYGEEARRLLDRARQHGDWIQLQEVIHRFFHTAAGFQAADLWATRWLDRGHYAMARRWDQLVSEPTHQRRKDASIVLKAALAYRLCGQLRRAEELLGGLAASSVKVAGRRIQPEAWLAEHAGPSDRRQTTSEWQLALGNERHNGNSDASPPLLEPLWTVALPADRRLQPTVREWEMQWLADAWKPSAVAKYPIVVGNQLVVRDWEGISAFDALSGKCVWRYKSDWPSTEAIAQSADAMRMSQAKVWDALCLENTVWGMLSGDGRCVYAVEFSQRAGQSTTNVTDPATAEPKPYPMFGPDRSRETQPFQSTIATRLIALDTQQVALGENRFQKPIWTADGALDQRAILTTPGGDADRDQTLAGHDFLGPPLPIDGLLYAITESEQQVNLLTLEAATGTLIRSQAIAITQPTSSRRDPDRRYAVACSPASAGGVIVCPTLSGTLVAFDTLTGELLWTHAGDHRDPIDTRRRTLQRSYGGEVNRAAGFLNLPVIQKRSVVFLPKESDHVYCVDLLTGQSQWPDDVERTDSDLYVATVTDRTVMIVGSRTCRGLDMKTGKQTWARGLGIPSGHGIRSGPNYLLPLKSGRVATIEIDSGREIGLAVARRDGQFGVSPEQLGFVTGRPLTNTGWNRLLGQNVVSTSRDEGQSLEGLQMPGNLVAYRDVLVSIGPRQMTVFPQAAPLLQQTRAAADGLDPQASEVIRVAELELILGKTAAAVTRLRHVLSDPAMAQEHAHAQTLMREVLELTLAADPEAGPAVMEQWNQLAHTPVDRVRFLMRKAGWQWERQDFEGVFRSACEIDALNVRRLLSPHDDANRWVSAHSWAAGVMTRLKMHRHRQTASASSAAGDAVSAGLDTAMRACLKAGDVESLRRFLAVYASWPQAEPVRATLAERLIGEGALQEAELLLLENRQSRNPRVAAGATQALLLLWDHLGLHVEAARLLEEMNQRYADVALSESETGSDFFRRFPGSDLTLSAYRRMMGPDWPIERVHISEQRWIDIDPSLQEVYGRYRRRYFTPENGSFHLLDRGVMGDGALTVVDKHSGAIAGSLHLPARHSYPSASHSTYAGHLVPVVGTGTMHGLSLLEFADRKPLWNAMFTPPGQPLDLVKAGPAGRRFCTFQSRRNLLAVESATGRLLWLRSDIVSPSGLDVDREAGLLGDDKALVLFSADRATYATYRTSTGEMLRQGTLNVDVRYPLRPFGRKLFYVGKDADSRRLRIWDPLTGRFDLDEPFRGLVLAAKTPDRELAFVVSPARLRIMDVDAQEVRLDVQLNPALLIGLQHIQVFGDHDRYYLNVAQRRNGVSAKQLSEPLSDTFLPASHIQGRLVAINRSTGRVLWQRLMPACTVLRFNAMRMPFLVTMSRVSRRVGNRRPTLLIEILDGATGDTLGLRNDLSPDRFVRAWYDTQRGRIELHGLSSRIDLNFDRARQRMMLDEELL